MEHDPVAPYKLYNDPSLKAAIDEGDAYLDVVLQGLKTAEDRAAIEPDNQTYQTIAEFAEESARHYIKRVGLATLEPDPENS